MDTDPKREKIKKDICTYLKEGLYKKDSATLAGIDESTLYRWIEADASFASRVEASILEYKRSLIRTMTVSARKNGNLALKILQIRWPKDWKSSQMEGEQNDTKRVANLLQEIFDEKDSTKETNYDFS